MRVSIQQIADVAQKWATIGEAAGELGTIGECSRQVVDDWISAASGWRASYQNSKSKQLNLNYALHLTACRAAEA